MGNKNTAFDNFDFGSALEGSLKQAVSFKNGDISHGRISVCEIPTPVYDGTDVRRIRETLRLSQNGLAVALGVSKRTVEAWEAGKSNPSNVANKLIYLIEKNQELLNLLIMPKTHNRKSRNKTTFSNISGEQVQ
jgi:putative transcriptional regulator